jgi:hypothetical protein
MKTGAKQYWFRRDVPIAYRTSRNTPRSRQPNRSISESTRRLNPTYSELKIKKNPHLPESVFILVHPWLTIRANLCTTFRAANNNIRASLWWRTWEANSRKTVVILSPFPLCSHVEFRDCVHPRLKSCKLKITKRTHLSFRTSYCQPTSYNRHVPFHSEKRTHFLTIRRSNLFSFRVPRLESRVRAGQAESNQVGKGLKRISRKIVTDNSQPHAKNSGRQQGRYRRKETEVNP